MRQLNRDSYGNNIQGFAPKAITTYAEATLSDGYIVLDVSDMIAIRASSTSTVTYKMKTGVDTNGTDTYGTAADIAGLTYINSGLEKIKINSASIVLEVM